MARLYLYAIGALVVVLLIGGFMLHYRHLADEAAKVPGLEQQIRDADKRADDLAARLAAADAARKQADLDLSAWQQNAADILEAIKNGGAHAAAATDPKCAPGDDDRRLRNTTLDRLIGAGSDRSPAPVPEATDPPR